MSACTQVQRNQETGDEGPFPSLVALHSDRTGVGRCAARGPNIPDLSILLSYTKCPSVRPSVSRSSPDPYLQQDAFDEQGFCSFRHLL